jgi:hypothetical protein
MAELDIKRMDYDSALDHLGFAEKTGLGQRPSPLPEGPRSGKA